MRVLPVGTLSQPLEEVQAVGLGHGELVAVEDVQDVGGVAIGGELVGQELGILPDSEDVGEDEEGDAVVLLGALGLGDVHVVLADLDYLAGGLAPATGSIRQPGVHFTVVARGTTLYRLDLVRAMVCGGDLLMLEADGAALSWGVGGHDVEFVGGGYRVYGRVVRRW